MTPPVVSSTVFSAPKHFWIPLLQNSCIQYLRFWISALLNSCPCEFLRVWNPARSNSCSFEFLCSWDRCAFKFQPSGTHAHLNILCFSIPAAFEFGRLIILALRRYCEFATLRHYIPGIWIVALLICCFLNSCASCPFGFLAPCSPLSPLPTRIP